MIDFEALKRFVEAQRTPPRSALRAAFKIKAECGPCALCGAAPAAEEDESALRERIAKRGKTFSEMLLYWIDERGEKDSDVYKRAGVDRKLFSKIRSDVNYTPKKRTAILFAFALSLNEDQTRDLLARAGYSLSDADAADIIVQYFLQTGNHDLYELDEALVRFGEQPIYSE